MGIEELNNEIERINPSDLLTTFDRHRDYSGQPWTDNGLRGRTEVKGITMRDIKDCYIRACYDSALIPEGEYPKTIFDLDWSEVDPMAVIENTLCWIERYMGISPNTKCVSFEQTMNYVPLIDLADDTK